MTCESSSDRCNTSTNDGKLCCNECDFTTPHRFSLLRHFKAKHSSSNETVHKCDVCHQILLTKKSLTRHKFKAHSQGNETCTHCDKTYTTRSALKVHVRLKHVGVKGKFRCELCDKNFEQKHHFDGHMDKHAGIKRHECAHCGKKFSYRTSFCKHRCRLPAEKKKIPCDKCGLEFLKKSYLNEHMIGKHSDKCPYVCKYCSMTFHWRGSWANHQSCCKANANDTNTCKTKENASTVLSQDLVTVTVPVEEATVTRYAVTDTLLGCNQNVPHNHSFNVQTQFSANATDSQSDLNSTPVTEPSAESQAQVFELYQNLINKQIDLCESRNQDFNPDVFVSSVVNKAPVTSLPSLPDSYHITSDTLTMTQVPTSLSYAQTPFQEPVFEEPCVQSQLLAADVSDVQQQLNTIHFSHIA